MFQVINSRIYFVVDLKDIPKTPISDGGDPTLTPYANALTSAIEGELIRKPGKYAISVNPIRNLWNVFEVLE